MGTISSMIKWKWFIVEGLVLFGLGILAIARPGIAVEAVISFFGWLLLVIGVVTLFGGVTSASQPRSQTSIASGLLALIFGLVLLLLPSPAIATITVILAIFFLMSGFTEISSSMALRSKGGSVNHWGLAFFSGLIAVVLGVLMLVLWPVSIEVIGLLLGINFLISGSYLISLGWFVRYAPLH
jgi:uncharacterized membrane protein HdeD (DUF308 family)